MMKRLASIRFYALAVCFVSVICIAITTGFALYNLMTLAAPQLTIDPYRIQYLSSNTAFTQSPGAYLSRGPAPGLITGEGFAQGQSLENRFANMSEAEISAVRLERLQSELAFHQQRAGISLLRQAIIILVSSILFLIHWRLAKANNDDNQPDINDL